VPPGRRGDGPGGQVRGDRSRPQRGHGDRVDRAGREWQGRGHAEGLPGGAQSSGGRHAPADGQQLLLRHRCLRYCAHQRAARRVRGGHVLVRLLPPFRSDPVSVRGAGARGDRGRPGTGRGGVAVLRGHRPRERCHRVHRQLRGVRGAQAALRGELEWRIVRAAVLGSPVAHSLSPVLHTAAYRALGMEGWSYGLYECTEEELAPFLTSLDSRWAGLSLPMPLKRRALELAHRATELATGVGGANTLVHKDAGWQAHNTDVEGITAALAESGIVAPRTAIVLGAGATAASTVAALRELGAGTDITVLARDLGRTGEVTAAAERLGCPVRVAPLAEFDRHMDVD